jgi:hypothetical protein
MKKAKRKKPIKSSSYFKSSSFLLGLGIASLVFSIALGIFRWQVEEIALSNPLTKQDVDFSNCVLGQMFNNFTKNTVFTSCIQDIKKQYGDYFPTELVVNDLKSFIAIQYASDTDMSPKYNSFIIFGMILGVCLLIIGTIILKFKNY